MANDALNQILTHVVTLANPDQQALLGIDQQETTPVIAVFEEVMRALGGGRAVQLRCLGGTHQKFARIAPDLESQTGFIRMCGFTTALDSWLRRKPDTADQGLFRPEAVGAKRLAEGARCASCASYTSSISVWLSRNANQLMVRSPNSSRSSTGTRMRAN